MLEELNAYRRSKGKKFLLLDSCLCDTAEKHAQSVFAGVRPHANFDVRLARCYYNTGAENYGFGSNVFERWKRSKKHRQNMLGNYDRCGFGTYKGHTVLILASRVKALGQSYCVVGYV